MLGYFVGLMTIGFSNEQNSYYIWRIPFLAQSLIIMFIAIGFFFLRESELDPHVGYAEIKDQSETENLLVSAGKPIPRVITSKQNFTDTPAQEKNIQNLRKLLEEDPTVDTEDMVIVNTDNQNNTTQSEIITPEFSLDSSSNLSRKNLARQQRILQEGSFWAQKDKYVH
eukprot:UN33107